MSLLTNPWFQVGMGLLANSGPSLSPVNPWRGIGQGLMAANEAKVAEAEQQYRQQMMERQQQEYEQEAKRQEMMQQWAQTQKDPALAALFPQQAAEAALRQPDAPNLPAGWMMGPDGQAMMIPGYTPEAEDNRTSDQKNYEVAVEQGYTGSFLEYQRDLAKAKATNINNIPAPPAGYAYTDPTNPSAGMSAIPGGPATKPTDTQSNAAGFASIMGAAGQQIAELESSGIAPTTLQDTYVPDAIARPEIQQYRAAQRAWVRAKLRKESGATIGKDEMADEIRTFFPQYRDSPQVIEDKRLRRLQAEAEMRKQAGPANPGDPAQDQDVFRQYNLKRPPK